jgi:hypothetical protein
MRTRTTNEYWTLRTGEAAIRKTVKKGNVVLQFRCFMHGSEHPLLRVVRLSASERVRYCEECDYASIESDAWD